MEVRVEKREEGFIMLKGGKGYTVADIEALPEGLRFGVEIARCFC